MTTPKAGDPLTFADFDMIMEAVTQRKKNFPNEPSSVSLGVIFFNIGERFAKITCTEGEWEGLKSDVVTFDLGEPRCSNGHELTKEPGLKLGWVAAEE